MAAIPQIVVAQYWLILIPAAAAITWLTFIILKRLKTKQASLREAPLRRIYETRLQAAGAGNSANVKRLIEAELNRRPHITEVEVTRRAYNRFKSTQRNAGGRQNAR
jgi:hypothetical protein